jgi:ribosomal protein L40E
MSLEKFKICPACGKHNHPSRLECQNCQTDLTGTKVMDSEPESMDTPTSAPHEELILVKICDCGAENSPQSRKCSQCGEDISDIRPIALPSMDISTDTPKSPILRAIDDNFSFILEKPILIVGRETDMQDYLSKKLYVSRKHAQFTISNGNVYIENLSKTNYTFVNNVLIPSDKSTLLVNGDEIGLGGKNINGSRQKDAAYFIFEWIL